MRRGGAAINMKHKHAWSYMVRTSCRKCGEPGPLTLCQGCTAKQAASQASGPGKQARPSRQARGYDANYEAQRRELGIVIRDLRSSGREVHCVICGLVIHTSDPWTAEHLDPLRFGRVRGAPRLGPAHPRCNFGWRRARAGA